MNNLAVIATTPTPAPSDVKPKNIKDAASQFEAMLMQQMLRSTRESLSADSGDSGGGTMRDFAEQNLAQMLARSGGLGIGSMIARGLQQHQANTSGKESATMRKNGN